MRVIHCSFYYFITFIIFLIRDNYGLGSAWAWVKISIDIWYCYRYIYFLLLDEIICSLLFYQICESQAMLQRLNVLLYRLKTVLRKSWSIRKWMQIVVVIFIILYQRLQSWSFLVLLPFLIDFKKAIIGMKECLKKYTFQLSKRFTLLIFHKRDTYIIWKPSIVMQLKFQINTQFVELL